MCYTQENIIFCSAHAIFDERLFSKYTDSHAKEHKLYDKLLDKISLETELSVPDPSRKDGLTPVFIPHTPISPILNNPLTCFSSPSLSYKSTSPPSTPESKKSIAEIEEDNYVNSDVEMKLLSPQ